MPSDAKLRVLIADDQALVRDGFGMILSAQPDIDVVGEAADGAEAVRLAAELAPDVVLMDIRMPGMDGIEATRRLLAGGRLPGTSVILLTTFDTDEHIFDAIRAGAAGFLLKDVHPGELRQAIRVVARGDALLSPAVTRRVMDMAARSAAHRPDPALTGGLTERERDVLTQIGLGRSNDELAAELHITPATARTYVSRLLTKLDARDRSQLVGIAYRAGLVGQPG